MPSNTTSRVVNYIIATFPIENLVLSINCYKFPTQLSVAAAPISIAKPYRRPNANSLGVAS